MARVKSRTKRFRLNNFTGGMNTTSELNAFATIDPSANLGPGVYQQIPLEFLNMDNWLPIQRGGISKASGFTELFDVGQSTPITGLYRYMKSDGTNLFLVSYGSTLAKYTGSLTTLYTSLASGEWVDFETANDTLVICDGTNAPLKFDGTTVSTLGGSPPEGVRQSLWYQNQLFMFSETSNQSLVYYSDPDDIEAGYATNFVQCDVNDGQKIKGIYKFFVPGVFASVIIVAKERSMGIIQGDGSTVNPYFYTRVSEDVGMSSFRAFVQYAQDILFLTPRGINSYKGVQQNINISFDILTAKIRDQFINLSPSTAPNSFAWGDPINRRVSFAVPTGANTYPDTIWHYDTDQRCWYKQTGFTLTTAFQDTDASNPPDIYHGDATGKVYKHETATLSYDTGIINATAQTGYIDFFEPRNFKRIKEATVYVRGNGAYTMGVGCTLNYGDSIGSSHSVSLGSTSYLWNGGVWTDDSGVYQWGSPSIVRQKFYPKGIFQSISFSFANSGADQPLDIFELDIEVEYLDQT